MAKPTSQSPNGSASNRNQQNDKRSDKGGRTGKAGRNGRTKNNNDNKPTKNGFRGQLQNGALKGVVITENTNQRPTQFRKMKLTLPSFCAEQGYDGVHDIVRDMKDWDKNKHFTKRPDASQWSETMEVKVAEDKNGKAILRTMAVVVDPELKEQLLGEWKTTKKYQDIRWNKCQEDKKKLITLIRGQLDEGTVNELEISPGYSKAVEDGDIVKIMSNLRTICFGDDDGGLSYKPYKAAIAVKSLCNFKSPKQNDPHYFKDELRTKFQATLALANRFPNGTVYMEEALAMNEEDDGSGKMVPKPLTIEHYFAMTEEKRAYWEKKGDERNMAMIYINNCQNEDMKRDLRMAYSHGNKECYNLDVESLARLQSTQYRKQDTRTSPNSNDNNSRRRRNGRSGDGKENVDPNNGWDEQPLAGAHPDAEGTDKNNNVDDKKDGDDVGDDDASLAHIIVKKTTDTNNHKNTPKQRTANEILGTHPVDDPIWNMCDDASVDSCDSEENMAGMYSGYGEAVTDHDEDERKPTQPKLNLFEGYTDVGSDSSDTNNEDDLHMFKNDGDEDNFYPDGKIESESYEDEDELNEDEIVARNDLFGHTKVEDTSSVRKKAHDTTKLGTLNIEPRKYYAVARGKIPGIYTDWGTCATQVLGVSKAVYKGFTTKEAAVLFIDTYNKSQKPSSKPQQPNSNMKLHSPNTRVSPTIRHIPHFNNNQKCQPTTTSTSTGTGNDTLHESDLPQDCNGVRLYENDIVMILNNGGWAVKGKTGKIIKFGVGRGKNCNLSLAVKKMPIQNRMGGNVILVSRGSIDSLSEQLQDFHFGQHQN